MPYIDVTNSTLDRLMKYARKGDISRTKDAVISDLLDEVGF